MRREAVGVLLVGTLLTGLLNGCTSETTQVGRLRSPVPQERFEAVLWLARHGSPRSIGPLIDSLEDEDPSVRWAAVHALRDLTGREFGYRPEAPAPQRREAARRWRRWWSGRKEGRPVNSARERGGGAPSPGATPNPQGSAPTTTGEEDTRE